MVDKFIDKAFKKQNKKTRLIILISALGLLIFILAASLLPFKDKLFSSLFPKPSSHAAGLNDTIASPLTLASTYASISVYAPFSGDDNGSNTAILEYKKSSDTTWKKGMDLTVDRRDVVTGFTKVSHTFVNLWKNQYRASLIGLQSNTSYDVRVTFSDGDGVSGGNGGSLNQVATAISTRNENPPIGSGTTYYVSTTGNDTNSGKTTDAPFKTIQHAADIVNPGDTILVRGGIYTSATSAVLNMNRSGTDTAYIDIENYPGEKPVINASLSPIGAGTGSSPSCGAGSSSQAPYRCGIVVTGAFVRIKGFDIIGANIGIKLQDSDPYHRGLANHQWAHDDIIDGNNLHNLVYAYQANSDGSESSYAQGIQVGNNNNEGVDFPATNPLDQQNLVKNIVIQNNTVIPPSIDPADSTNYPTDIQGGIQFYNTSGGHIIRNNTVRFTYSGRMGLHGADCIGGNPNNSIPGAYFGDSDIYNNACIGATDDGIEIDGGDINTRVWGNTITGSETGFSATPAIVGPLYVFRNVVYNLHQQWYKTCMGIKDGAGGQGIAYFYHNTFYLNNGSLCSGSASLIEDAGGNGISNVVLKNNIFHAYDRTINLGNNNLFGYNPTNFLSDYNLLYTVVSHTQDSTKNFAKYNGGASAADAVWYSTFASYQVGTGQDPHSLYGAAGFVNAANADFHLTSGSLGIDKGTVIPGFDDPDSAWAYQGNAPDLGAFESGFSAATPPSFSFQANNSYPLGGDIPVKVMMESDADNANTFVAKINFPANLVTVSKIASSSSFISNWVEESFDNSLGTISLAGGVPAPGYKTTGTPAVMATVYFTPKVTGSVALSFDSTASSSAIYRNSDNVNILALTPSITFSIISTNPTPTTQPPANNPTPTPTTAPIPTATPAPTYAPTLVPIPSATPSFAKGDFNHDGVVNFVDLSHLFSSWGKARANLTSPDIDINGDGIINSFDFAQLKQILIDKRVVKVQQKNSL